jgi:hypothetical protein
LTLSTVKAFLEELRTQHIYRIAAGYMVSSWLILQIASLLCSALGLPNWTLKAILALLLVGFGAALIIGWRIDLRAARLAAGGSRLRSRKVHFVLWPAAAILILGGRLWYFPPFWVQTKHPNRSVRRFNLRRRPRNPARPSRCDRRVGRALTKPSVSSSWESGRKPSLFWRVRSSSTRQIKLLQNDSSSHKKGSVNNS